MKKQLYSIIFSVFMLLVFCWMAWQALDFHELARYFPLYLSLVAVVLSLLSIFLQVKKYLAHRHKSNEANSEFNPEVFKYIGWIIGYVFLIFLLGFVIGTAVFLAAFLLFETKQSLIKTALSVTITIGMILLFGSLMKLYWPTGVLGNFI